MPGGITRILIRVPATVIHTQDFWIILSHIDSIRLIFRGIAGHYQSFPGYVLVTQDIWQAVVNML